MKSILVLVLILVFYVFSCTCVGPCTNCGPNDGCCNDLNNNGGRPTCFNKATHQCNNGTRLCPLGLLSCGQACYSPAIYQCLSGDTLVLLAEESVVTGPGENQNCALRGEAFVKYRENGAIQEATISCPKQLCPRGNALADCVVQEQTIRQITRQWCTCDKTDPEPTNCHLVITKSTTGAISVNCEKNCPDDTKLCVGQLIKTEVVQKGNNILTKKAVLSCQCVTKASAFDR